HPLDDKWDALHNPMPKRTALKIVEACYEVGVHNIVAEIQDNVFLDQYDEKIIDIFKTGQEDSPFTIGSLKSNLTNDTTSLLIHPKEDRIQELLNNLNNNHDKLIGQRK